MKSLYATTRWKGACQVGLIVIASSLVVGCETIPIDSFFSPGTKTSEASGPVIDDCDGRASIAISRFRDLKTRYPMRVSGTVVALVTEWPTSLQPL